MESEREGGTNQLVALMLLRGGEGRGGVPLFQGKKKTTGGNIHAQLREGGETAVNKGYRKRKKVPKKQSRQPQ